MIFVTVGSQLPFDRLIATIDEIAPRLPEPVFAQIGDSDYEPRHLEWVRLLPATEFDRYADMARVLVSHAGIGTILWALNHRKPIAVVPRRAALHEHRNDHQMATARHMRGRPGIVVVERPEELETFLVNEEFGASMPGEDGPARSIDELRSRLSAFFREVRPGA